MPANTAETLNVLAQMKDPGKRRELAMGVVDTTPSTGWSQVRP